MTTRIALCLLMLGAMVTLQGSAYAHSNEHLAKLEGPHGGLLRMVDQYHIELAIKQGEVWVWVTDHGDNPQSTDGAAGQVMLVSANGGGTIQVDLLPEGQNGLHGNDSRIQPDDALRAVVTLTMKGQKTVNVRFAK